MLEHLLRYSKSIRDFRRASPAAPETAMAPAMQELLRSTLAEIPSGEGLKVDPLFRKPGAGRPDFALIRPSASARAFVELKYSPPPKLNDPDFVRLTDAQTPVAEPARPLQGDGDHLELRCDGSGRVMGLSSSLQLFMVGGYTVLKRWMRSRIEQPVNLELFGAFRDVCARIDEHIEHSIQADRILEDIPASTLNRETLQVSTA